jgi:hypothetical protein
VLQRLLVEANMNVQSLTVDIDVAVDGAIAVNSSAQQGTSKDSMSSKASKSLKHKGRRQMDDE